MFCDYHDSIGGSFGAFSFHESQKEAIAQRMADEYYAGNTNFSVDLIDDMSQDDLDDIQDRFMEIIGG